MMRDHTMKRRSFIKVSALAGGGLMLQVALPGATEELGTLVGSDELNAYIRIASDGRITIYSATPEMGQGIQTALPMIIAEEMDANWDDVEVINSAIDFSRFGMQGAGGSTSIPRQFDTMRRLGASAREMLIGAAADELEVDRKDLRAENSRVIHVSGRTLTFGELAAAAVRQPAPDPEMLSFKDPRSYTILGKAVSGVDNLVIATGRSQFGIDVDAPGMKHASYTRCPRHGGIAKRFNEAAIKALPGVTDAFIVAPDASSGKAQMAFLTGLAALQGGVAIVGDDTWSVFNAKSKLEVEWDDSAASTDDWDAMNIRAREIAKAGGGTVRKDNPDVAAALADPNNQTLEAFYEFPYVAHVCMEPMNCTVDYRPANGDDPARMEIWIPSQFPQQVTEIAGNMLGVAPQNVVVHGTRMGGGFGRRAIHDFAAEAMAISKQAGIPVKLTWTRTDDIHNDFFRVGGFEAMRGAVTKNGKLAGLDQHYIGFGHGERPVIGSGLNGNEFTMATLDQTHVTQSLIDIATPCGPWRAPGSNTNAFVEQSFLDELAALAGRDYADFLIELMGKRRWLADGNVNALNTGRAIDTIRTATEKAGWGRAMPQGKGLGLAFYFCHAAHVAEVAEVTVNSDRTYHIDRVTAAIDVGPIINMSGAVSQVQGSIVDGISTMALQQITVTDGVIQEDNFDEYKVMRISATPEIDVHFIQSDNPPTGLGEPALPPLAPAVTNAIFAASGERIRTMPLSKAGFRLV